MLEAVSGDLREFFDSIFYRRFRFFFEHKVRSVDLDKKEMTVVL